MEQKYIPFKPNAPVFSGMFAGRAAEIIRIDNLLYQAKMNNPTHLIITGERGIGKSSLLMVANHMAKGDVQWGDNTFDFLTVQLSLSNETTFDKLAYQIKAGIERELSKIEKAKEALSAIWAFVQRLEIGPVKIKEARQKQESISELVISSISDTIQKLTSNDQLAALGLSKAKDGLVLLFDEVDSCSSDLNLGAFFKELSEQLALIDANKFMIILSGLPRVRDVLRTGHESSLRLFEEHELKPLSAEDVQSVIEKGVTEYKKQNSVPIEVKESVAPSFFLYSEGYPHFVQQIAYSVFLADRDNVIDQDDITQGVFGDKGAYAIIGDRYYKDIFFNKIDSDAYREILIIMSAKSNQWISKKEIKDKFSKSETTLNNGIKALRDRSIILSREGSSGVYRLQWNSFAFWIQNYGRKRLEGLNQK